MQKHSVLIVAIVLSAAFILFQLFSSVFVITSLSGEPSDKLCKNAKSTWEASCTAKFSQELCENSDFDGDGLKDCVWDSVGKFCKRANGPGNAGIPPECR